jgi:uncharacterized membrane protein
MGKNPKTEEIVHPSAPAALADAEPLKNSPGAMVKRGELRVETCAGPLPPAWFLEQYEDLIPGTAQRIFERFEKQSDHRMQLERAVVMGNSRRASIGQGAAFLLSAMIIGSATWLGYLGHDWLAAAFVSSNVAGLAYVFVRGRMLQKAERAEKLEQAKE